MTARGEKPSQRTIRMIGWGLVMFGFGILLLIEKCEDSETVVRDTNNPSKDRSKRSIKLMARRITFILLIPVLFLGTLFVIAQSISQLVVLDIIPGGKFSPNLRNAVILATILSILGYGMHDLSDKIHALMIDHRWSESMSEYTRILMPFPIGLFVLILAFTIVTRAYTPIQWILQPTVVENVLDLDQWIAPTSDRITLFAGVLAAMFSIVYYQISKCIYHILWNVD